MTFVAITGLSETLDEFRQRRNQALTTANNLFAKNKHTTTRSSQP